MNAAAYICQHFNAAAKAAAPCAGIRGQPGQTQHRQRIAGQTFSQERGMIGIEVSRSHRREPKDPPALDGDVRRADVMTELILTGVCPKESVEVGIAGSEGVSIVVGPERPNVHGASSGRAGRGSDVPGTTGGGPPVPPPAGTD
jgi:hypothetical protein